MEAAQSTPQVTVDAVKSMIDTAVETFNTSGILQGDEADDLQCSVAILIPERNVALMIGQQGANINELKAATGIQFSFTKKDTSAAGFRRAFLSGPLAGVAKAIAISVHLTVMQGSPSSIALVVSNRVAGKVIGKGGENLKSVREITGCNVNMEKPHETPPGFVGRTLTMTNEASTAVTSAAYHFLRLDGFQSPKQSEQPEDAFGYGPMSKAGGARFSPYGGAGNVCAIHGKRRGERNLQPNPANPSQLTCFDNDQCKGGANISDGAGSALATLGQFGAATYGGLGGLGMGGLGGNTGGMQGQMGQMGQMGLGGYGGLQGLQGGFQGMSSPVQGGGGLICSTHNKKRGATNLQPHASMPGMFVCRADDNCK
jgi:transcription antitermination factor NusA-like protein